MVDFTQRERSEEEINNSEELFKIIFEYAPDAYYLSDLKGKFIDVNRVAEAVIGYKRQEIIGKSLLGLDLLSPDQIPKAVSLLAKNAQGRPTGPDELVLKRKIGDKVSLEIRTYPVKVKGEIVVLGIARDITERKKAEELLRESEERFRSVVEHSHEGILVLDDAFRIIYVNAEGTRISGYPSEEIVGRDFREFVADASKDQVANYYILRQRGEPVPPRYEFDIVRKGGETRSVEISSSVIKDSKGIVETTAQMLDITERKRAKEQLEESFKNLRKAMNGIIQAIALTVERRDPYTAGHQRRVADLAWAIATTMDLPKEQIEGIRIAGVIHDIGKIAVPAEILSRPGRLNDYEFSLIKEHPKIGYEILKEIEFPWPIAQIVYQHHERLDGSGYPQGLAGQNILLEARILAVADVVEAMASHRPYRAARGVEKALEEISINRATRYDREAVDACLRLFREKEFIFR
jgi:PAS domain S-box-containing protein/putative nucleotidyltransferase with HDIG domain